ncbi:uncharacterized protein LOC129752149 [Uranotaenia lowii]|uniref:uncharacterized protein LOC129752149 n=1 Tax=Uranotaenia lowii TaxID=190385 RepID=UPI00247A72A6|nr:uncharacterized protein LOC129752149 [Uranotaenia lowii]
MSVTLMGTTAITCIIITEMTDTVTVRRGKLPDCCYFNHGHHDHHHHDHHEEYDSYRVPEKKRVPEEPHPEPTSTPVPLPNLYDGAPTPAPAVIETTTLPKAKSYIDPEPLYIDEKPKECCTGKSDVHCVNCHIYPHGHESHSSVDKYGGDYDSGHSSGYRAAPGSSGDHSKLPAPTAAARPTKTNPIPQPPQPSHKPTSSHARSYDGGDDYGHHQQAPIYHHQSSSSGGYEHSSSSHGGHVEFSHHKVVIPSDHLHKIFDHPKPALHPIDLTIYNQIVNQELFDQHKSDQYGTEIFQPTKQPHRDYYQPRSYNLAAATFPPAPLEYRPKDYLPITPPPGAYVAPIPPHILPPYYSTADSGPAIFEILNDSPPPTSPPPPHYVQVQAGSYYPFDANKYRMMMAARQQHQHFGSDQMVMASRHAAPPCAHHSEPHHAPYYKK